MNIMDYVIAAICILLTFGGMIWYAVITRRGRKDDKNTENEKKSEK